MITIAHVTDLYFLNKKKRISSASLPSSRSAVSSPFRTSAHHSGDRISHNDLGLPSLPAIFVHLHHTRSIVVAQFLQSKHSGAG